MSKLFADDPAEYFGYDNHQSHHIPRKKVETLQLAALQARFVKLKGKLPPLAALASAQSIDEIATLEAAAPLLFPHNIYKSYPEELLSNGNYGLLTKWLSRLTTNDLSSIMAREFETMDDWMDALDVQDKIEICHSSGTSGRLSFFPRGKHEVKMRHHLIKMKFTDSISGKKIKYGDWPFSIIWPAQSFGRTAILRTASTFRSLLTEKEEDYHPYLPTALSSDHHYYAMRCQNLLNEGYEDGLEPSDYVRARLEETNALVRDMSHLQQRLLDTVAGLKNKQRIMMFGGPVTIHKFATAGLERGMGNMFMEGSFVVTGGGLKNFPARRTLYEEIRQFTGDVFFKDSYGMTELISGFDQCDYGRYHIPPWIIPYLIDDKSRKLLPRTGKQAGRAAFFDLPAQTYWGGIVTADFVEIDWGTCPCTRTTPHIGPEIARIDETVSGHIGTASHVGISAATEALTAGLPIHN